MNMGTRVDIVEDVLVVHIVGDLDLATSPRIRNAAVSSIEDGFTSVIADLSMCDFIDSVGIGTLIGLLRRARTLGGNLELVIPDDGHRATFALCDLDRVFTFHDDIDAARRALVTNEPVS